MKGNMIVTADGNYPDDTGEEFITGPVSVTIRSPRGAKVTVQSSRDGGETWELHWPFPFRRLRSRRSRRCHPRYERRFNLSSPLRMRINVSDFNKEFAIWLDGR